MAVEKSTRYLLVAAAVLNFLYIIVQERIFFSSKYQCDPNKMSVVVNPTNYYLETMSEVNGDTRLNELDSSSLSDQSITTANKSKIQSATNNIESFANIKQTLEAMLMNIERRAFDHLDRSLLLLQYMHLYAAHLNATGAVLPTLSIVHMNGLSNVLGHAHPGTAEFSTCPIKECSILGEEVHTYRGQINEFDVILWSNDVFWPNMREGRRRSQLWVIRELEAPARWGGFRDFSSHVNFTATYRWDSTIPEPYGRFIGREKGLRAIDPTGVTRPVPLHRNRSETDTVLGRKDREVAWVVSNCFSSANNRWAYATELAKHIQVDIYGFCTLRKCTDCFEMIRQHYRYYLAFENSNCHDYITEKFLSNSIMYA